MTEQQARDFAEALGAEISHWRKIRRLNRGELAKLVDVSETQIGRIERGSEDSTQATTVVWRIARALGLSFADLVRRAEDALSLSDPSDTIGQEEAQAALDSDEIAGASEFDD